MSDINIPTSLANNWKDISQDKEVSKGDYAQLVKTAISDDDLTIEEMKFLSTIKDKLDSSKTGKVNVTEGKASGTFSFVEEKKKTDILDSLLNLGDCKVEEPKPLSFRKKEGHTAKDLPEKIFKPGEEIKVKAGEKFAISVDSNASVGRWQSIDPKDIKANKAVKLVGQDATYPPEGNCGGSNIHYFIFEAKEKGEMTIPVEAGARPGLNPSFNGNMKITVE